MEEKMQHLPIPFLWHCSRHPNPTPFLYEEMEHLKQCDFCLTRWWACKASKSFVQVSQRMTQIIWEAPCGDKTTLLQTYVSLGQKYSAAVTRLNEVMVAMSDRDYELVHRLVVAIREETAAARSKLRAHVEAHGCNRWALNLD
jgi:hypothetical protein